MVDRRHLAAAWPVDFPQSWLAPSLLIARGHLERDVAYFDGVSQPIASVEFRRPWTAPPGLEYTNSGMTPMTRRIFLGLVLLAGLQGSATAREAKLVRYPDYHDGKVVFCLPGRHLDRRRGRQEHPAPDRAHRPRHPSAVLARRPIDRVFLGPRGKHGRLPDSHRRRGRQAADDPLGRRHGARLDSRRQGRPLRQPARRGFHGQALRRLDRRRPAPGRRARHGRRRLVSLRMAPSWPSTARPRLTGASTTAAPIRATSPSWTWPPRPSRTWPSSTAWTPGRSGAGTASSTSSATAKERARPTSGASARRRRGRAGHPVHQRRRPLSRDQRRRQDDRLRARLRHLEARRRQPGGQADPARDRRRNPGDADRVPGLQFDRRRL